MNICTILYVTVSLFFRFWPVETPTTADSMNYSILVLGFVVFFCVIYYFTKTQKMYKGTLTERRGFLKN